MCDLGLQVVVVYLLLLLCKVCVFTGGRDFWVGVTGYRKSCVRCYVLLDWACVVYTVIIVVPCCLCCQP